MTIKIKHLNEVPNKDFVTLLGDIVENSPWLMERAAKLRPFSSVRGLHQAVSQVILDASEREKLDLICAHNCLDAEMTGDSANEQYEADPDMPIGEEFKRFEKLNDDYESKFGFSFIIAKKDQDRSSALESLIERFENTEEIEQREALNQIGKIIRDKLAEMVVHDE